MKAMPRTPRTLAVMVLAALCFLACVPFSTPFAQPTDSEPAIQAREVLGVGITDHMELEAVVKGEHVTIPLLGVEASDEPCILTKQTSILNEQISGEILYLVQYAPRNNSPVSPQYVFLPDSTFLNKQLLLDGMAKASDDAHLYRDEFIAAEQIAHEGKKGVWSTRCTSTPTPTRILTKTVIPTRTPTPTIKASVNGVSTKAVSSSGSPSPTSGVNLSAYIPPPPTDTPAPSRSLSSERIFNLINEHRKEKGLIPFEKDDQLCKLAESRAPELHDEIYGGSYVHAGMEKRNIPYWITENMASYGSEEAIVTWWLGSLVHRRAIEGSSKYSCGACAGNSCSQLFTSYIKK